MFTSLCKFTQCLADSPSSTFGKVSGEKLKFKDYVWVRCRSVPKSFTDVAISVNLGRNIYDLFVLAVLCAVHGAFQLIFCMFNMFLCSSALYCAWAKQEVGFAIGFASHQLKWSVYHFVPIVAVMEYSFFCDL